MIESCMVRGTIRLCMIHAVFLQITRLILANHQFLKGALEVEILKVGIRLAEGVGSFHSRGLHQGKVKVANRAVSLAALPGILDGATHLQFLPHSAQQNDRPVMTGAMMVT